MKIGRDEDRNDNEKTDEDRSQGRASEMINESVAPADEAVLTTQL